jgi:hypothetical protein
MKLESPYRFRERLLLIGGGGAGKTSATLSMIQASGLDAHVVDLDYSMAWQRAIDTDFSDIADQVEIHTVMPEWEAFIDELETIIDKHNTADAWLVIDSISPTWELVQSWYVGIAIGDNMGTFMAELRRDTKDLKEYNASIVENMNWPAIKKEYGRVWRAIMAWKGHLVLTAEAKSIKGERDADQLALYGQVGYKPVGEGRLHHVTSTTLFLEHGKRAYQFTTVKDRNREDVEKKAVEDLEDGGFADSYLREVAGWKLQKRANKLDVGGGE